MKLKRIILLMFILFFEFFGFYSGITAETISQTLSGIFITATAFPLIFVMKRERKK